MSKQSKVKCPKCKSKDIEQDYLQCSTCGGLIEYLCRDCGTWFDENGIEL